MLILTRRRALGFTVTVVGSAIFLGGRPEEAEANFFDDIASTVKGVANTVVNGVGYAAHSVADIAKSAVGTAESLVQTAAPAIMPVFQQAAQTFMPLLEQQIQQFAGGGGGGGGLGQILQMLPMMFNTASQPMALPVQTDRSDVPMQLSDSDEQHLRGDPNGYIQQNGGLLNDYMQRYSTGQQFHNFSVDNGAFNSYPVRPSGLSSRGFFPSRMSFGAELGELEPLLSMFLA